MDLRALLFVAAGYLAGSIPFSYLMGRFLGGKDVRREGSGNVGATNVFRVAGRTAGAAAAAGDILKSLLPVLAARLDGLDPAWAAATGGAAIIGHCYPVWLRFSGGKGVNSAIAVFTILFWPAAVAFGVVWLAVFKVSRAVSLASMIAVAVIPVTTALLGGERSYVVLGAAAALFIIYRHRSNIGRLLAGTESRVGKGEKKAD